ncbi:WhiB family transcriptional regulator [Streptomyces sp. NPDC002680]|uniref:WhiB family transcriptional regulator n=1 Tax=Streptomyces sp. NPDC002680 TaxID=3364659 RepID=UPI0036C16D57
MTTALSTRSAMSWWKAAHCRGSGIETFFPLPDDEATVQRALAICGRCPVRIPCRRYALNHRERHGIWGGLTEETRATLMRIGPPSPTGPPVESQPRSDR